MFKEITQQNFKEEVLDSNIPVIVDFYAPWCRPCMNLAPKIESLSEQIPHIKFVKINVDNEQELSTLHGIRSIPFLVVYDKGTILFTESGNHIESLINKVNAKEKEINGTD